MFSCLLTSDEHRQVSDRVCLFTADELRQKTITNTLVHKQWHPKPETIYSFIRLVVCGPEMNVGRFLIRCVCLQPMN